MQFIPLPVISVRAGAECACHCYRWRGSVRRLPQESGSCAKHSAVSAQAAPAPGQELCGANPLRGGAQPRFSHLWRTHGGMRLLSRHGRADAAVTMCTSLPRRSACRQGSPVPLSHPARVEAGTEGGRAGSRRGRGGRESGHPTHGPLPPRSGSAPAAA